jgi:hypothetical protein
MPVIRGELGERPRVRVGQGIPGGAGGLPRPSTAPLVPTPPPGIPHIRVPVPASLGLAAPSHATALPGSGHGSGAPILQPAPVVPQPPAPAPRRLSPAGFATDLTPSGHKADLAGRGAAMLMRGDQAKQLVNKYLGKHLGPGEKSALAALHSPEDLYNPDNHSQLQAVIRPDRLTRPLLRPNRRRSPGQLSECRLRLRCR